MLHSNRIISTLHRSVTTVLCAAMLTTGAMAASPKLQTIDVTPAAKTISVGQNQTFTATGNFSDGSKWALGPAISDIGPGSFDTCAVLTSGGVECWGHNQDGELGNGTKGNDRLAPQAVKGITTATAVTYEFAHACALLASGAAKCWGSGYLGDGGSGHPSTTPVSVAGITTATALSMGGNHSCALLASGEVRCWGENLFGQLGNGSTGGASNTPVSVAGVSTAVALAAGDNHTCALLASGAVQCWGYNAQGQLGHDTAPAFWVGTAVTVDGISNATAIAAAGGDSTCVLLAEATVQCWGDNYFGQLGNGSGGPNQYSITPVTVQGITTAKGITVGGAHACALLRSGSVQCWGYNQYGQLGDGTTNESNVPVQVQQILSPTKLAAGGEDTCALFSGGMMRCWGLNDHGQLGNRQKTTNPNPLPVTVVGTPGVVWASSNTAKATITDRGVATARAVGNTTITATTAGLINDNAVLTVK